MNRLEPNLVNGTLGELLVQLRLLQYGVQAAPPLKDTGNDLIAVRGRVFRAIQVKTTSGDRFDLRRLPKKYHLVACVRLVGRGKEVHLDECEIFLLKRGEIHGKNSYRTSELGRRRLTGQRVGWKYRTA
jgi:hypothetical protein